MVMLIVAAKKNPIAERIGSERNTTYLISPNVVLKRWKICEVNHRTILKN